MGVEAFLVACKALPADYPLLICRRKEGVVVLHLAVTLRASYQRFFSNLRVNIFDHFLIELKSILKTQVYGETHKNANRHCPDIGVTVNDFPGERNPDAYATRFGALFESKSNIFA